MLIVLGKIPCDVHFIFTFEASQKFWDILFNPLEAIADFPFFGSITLIKCQDVAVGLNLLSALSNGHSSDVITPYFSRAAAIFSVVANASSLLLITPKEVINLSWGYALHLLV